MKKLINLLFILVLFFHAAPLAAQCTPDPYITKPGIYPDSATGFPPAVATYPYNLTITVVVPADTLIPPLPLLPIDSIGVTGVEGLPEGFQFLPSRPSGFWPGGSKGCALIAGTPSKSQVGTYPLTFHVVGYIANLPFPYDITFYSIKILDSSNYGIEDASAIKHFNIHRAFPGGPLNMSLFSTIAGKFEFNLLNTHGRFLYSESIEIGAGENSLMFYPGKLAQGVYLIVLRDSKGKQVFVRRVLL
ncbi:MAG: hypothetical protein ACP5O2_06320 [Bacteroidales bacterium]